MKANRKPATMDVERRLTEVLSRVLILADEVPKGRHLPKSFQCTFLIRKGCIFNDTRACDGFGLALTAVLLVQTLTLICSMCINCLLYAGRHRILRN